jgi:hypothetical protein
MTDCVFGFGISFADCSCFAMFAAALLEYVACFWLMDEVLVSLGSDPDFGTKDLGLAPSDSWDNRRGCFSVVSLGDRLALEEGSRYVSLPLPAKSKCD